jgi:hypothetical protein
MLPEVRVPELAAQQSNLARVQHLVTGTPKKHQQLGPGKGKGIRDRLIEFAFAQAGQFSKNLLMHSIKHRPEFGLVGVRRGIRVRH